MMSCRHVNSRGYRCFRQTLPAHRGYCRQHAPAMYLPPPATPPPPPSRRGRGGGAASRPPITSLTVTYDAPDNQRRRASNIGPTPSAEQLLARVNRLRTASPSAESAWSEESDHETPTLGSSRYYAGTGCAGDSSDAESGPEGLEPADYLHNAGVYTAEEAALLARDKLVRQQALYIQQFSRLQHLLREGRRQYLRELKQERQAEVEAQKERQAAEAEKEKERQATQEGGEEPSEQAEKAAGAAETGAATTMTGAAEDDTLVPHQLEAQCKLKAAWRYHRHRGVSAVLRRKAWERRAGTSAPPGPRCILTEGGVRCGERCLPGSKYCLKHILNDPRQLLFVPCVGRRKITLQQRDAEIVRSRCRMASDTAAVGKVSGPGKRHFMARMKSGGHRSGRGTRAVGKVPVVTAAPITRGSSSGKKRVVTPKTRSADTAATDSSQQAVPTVDSTVQKAEEPVKNRPKAAEVTPKPIPPRRMTTTRAAALRSKETVARAIAALRSKDTAASVSPFDYTDSPAATRLRGGPGKASAQKVKQAAVESAKSKVTAPDGTDGAGSLKSGDRSLVSDPLTLPDGKPSSSSRRSASTSARGRSWSGSRKRKRSGSSRSTSNHSTPAIPDVTPPASSTQPSTLRSKRKKLILESTDAVPSTSTPEVENSQMESSSSKAEVITIESTPGNICKATGVKRRRSSSRAVDLAPGSSTSSTKDVVLGSYTPKDEQPMTVSNTTVAAEVTHERTTARAKRGGARGRFGKRRKGATRWSSTKRSRYSQAPSSGTKDAICPTTALEIKNVPPRNAAHSVVPSGSTPVVEDMSLDDPISRPKSKRRKHSTSCVQSNESSGVTTSTEKDVLPETKVSVNAKQQPETAASRLKDEMPSSLVSKVKEKMHRTRFSRAKIEAALTDAGSGISSASRFKEEVPVSGVGEEVPGTSGTRRRGRRQRIRFSKTVSGSDGVVSLKITPTWTVTSQPHPNLPSLVETEESLRLFAGITAPDVPSLAAALKFESVEALLSELEMKDQSDLEPFLKFRCLPSTAASILKRIKDEKTDSEPKAEEVKATVNPGSSESPTTASGTENSAAPLPITVKTEDDQVITPSSKSTDSAGTLRMSNTDVPVVKVEGEAELSTPKSVDTTGDSIHSKNYGTSGSTKVVNTELSPCALKTEEIAVTSAATKRDTQSEKQEKCSETRAGDTKTLEQTYAPLARDVLIKANAYRYKDGPAVEAMLKSKLVETMLNAGKTGNKEVLFASLRHKDAPAAVAAINIMNSAERIRALTSKKLDLKTLLRKYKESEVRARIYNTVVAMAEALKVRDIVAKALTDWAMSKKTKEEVEKALVRKDTALEAAIKAATEEARKYPKPPFSLTQHSTSEIATSSSKQVSSLTAPSSKPTSSVLTPSSMKMSSMTTSSTKQTSGVMTPSSKETTGTMTSSSKQNTDMTNSSSEQTTSTVVTSGTKSGSHSCKHLKSGSHSCKHLKSGSHSCKHLQSGSHSCKHMKSGTHSCKHMKSGAHNCKHVKSGAHSCKHLKHGVAVPSSKPPKSSLVTSGLKHSESGLGSPSSKHLKSDLMTSGSEHSKSDLTTPSSEYLKPGSGSKHTKSDLATPCSKHLKSASVSSKQLKSALVTPSVKHLKSAMAVPSSKHSKSDVVAFSSKHMKSGVLPGSPQNETDKLETQDSLQLKSRILIPTSREATPRMMTSGPHCATPGVANSNSQQARPRVSFPSLQHTIPRRIKLKRANSASVLAASRLTAAAARFMAKIAKMRLSCQEPVLCVYELDMRCPWHTLDMAKEFPGVKQELDAVKEEPKDIKEEPELASFGPLTKKVKQEEAGVDVKTEPNEDLADGDDAASIVESTNNLDHSTESTLSATSPRPEDIDDEGRDLDLDMPLGMGMDVDLAEVVLQPPLLADGADDAAMVAVAQGVAMVGAQEEVAIAQQDEDSFTDPPPAVEEVEIS